jgi:GAF domain-containing protein/HAMP domain-containing protein
MPEENKVTTQFSQPADDQRRARLLDRILLAGLIIAAITAASYIVLYFQTQAWQILAVAAGVAAGAACLLPARRRLRRNDLNGAGYWALAALVLAFGVGEVFWTNNTLFATLGALLLFFFIGGVVRPRRRGIWLAVAMAYGGFIVAVNLLQPLPRYDIAQVRLLNQFIPIAIGVLIVAVLWLIARGYLNYSLRTKLLIAFLAVSLASVGAVALYTNLTIRSLLQDQSASELTKVAEAQGTSIGDLLINEVGLLKTAGLDEAMRKAAADSNASYQGSPADIEDSLLTLDRQWLAAVAINDETTPLIRSKLENPIADYLREYRATYPENVEIFVTDRYGALLAATNRTSDYYQADEAWWQAAFNNGQGAIYYTQPAWDESSRTYSIDIALPLYERGGNTIVGILRTTLDLAAVLDRLANAQIGQTGHAEMLLPDSKFVKTSGIQDAEPELLAALSMQPGNISEVTWNGVPSFAAAVPVRSSDPVLGKTINQLNWRIVAHQSRSEILAPAEAQGQTVLLVMAAVVGIVIGSSLGLSQILVRPVTHLTAAANRVREGDLTAQAPVETRDEIGTLARTFNDMTAQLHGLVGTLEERIQARTEQLRASADVGRTAASVLEPDELLRSVVNLITDRFGFYYAAVFIIDGNGQNAVLREATGEAGRILKERHHQLEVNGQSMVGYAITRRRSRVALDVGTEAVRFANPLLPDTRSEIALPLMVGDRVLGALDVQSTQEAAFDEASAAVLQSMADQIAVALSNAEQFKQTEVALQRARMLYSFSQALSAADEPSEVLAALIDHIAPDANRGGILQLGPRQADGQLSYVEFAAAWVHPDFQSMLPPIKIGARLTPQQMPLANYVTSEKIFIVSDVNDPTLDPPLRELLQRFGAQAFAALPLVVGQQIVGVAVVGYRAPHLFDVDQLQVMQTLAGQAAIVLQNLRSAVEAQAALAQLDEINRRLTREAWSEHLRRRTAENVRWSSASDRAQEVDLAEVREALHGGQIATRLLDDHQQLGVAVPIKLRDVPIGAVHLVMPKREWNADMAAALDSIAGHIAQASETARLIDETERVAQREKAVADAADKIHRSTNIESVLQSAVTELQRITGRRGISVQLGFSRSAQPGGRAPNGETGGDR